MQEQDKKHNKAPTFISVVNQKGGVGKTTTVLNLATTVAASGKKVLILDLDAQGNASTGLGILLEQRKLSSYDVLIANENIQNVIKKTNIENLFIMPANQDLSSIDMNLAEIEKKASILKNSFKNTMVDLPNFDYVFMDCPPALNMLTVNALVLSNFIIIPLQTEFFALEGITQLVKTIDRIKENLNPELSIRGILLTMFDKRNKLSSEVDKEARNYFKDKVYKTVIQRNVRLSEAPSHGLPCVIYDKSCVGSKSYFKLAEEFKSKMESAA